MKIDLIIVCEDPTFGIRGSRKFWAASLNSDHGFAVQTRWGRIPNGTTINIKWLHGQQHKSVQCDNEEAAIKFIDTKAKEKAQKGYRVVVHEVDGINLAQLHCTAADGEGNIKMQTRRGV
jgi:predicted DNA-binding WGR domain protein